MQLDKKLFPLEGYFPYLGPTEGVDLGIVLEHYDAQVRDREV